MSASLHDMLPRDKSDTDRAQALVDLGWPAVAPVIAEIVAWHEDANWPVARVFQTLLVSVGKPLAPYILDVMSTGDHTWTYFLLEHVVMHSRELAAEIRPELERLAREPSAAERHAEIDTSAREILASLD